MRDLDNDAFLQQVLNELNELEDFRVYTPEDIENNLQKVDYVHDGATVEGRRFFRWTYTRSQDVSRPLVNFFERHIRRRVQNSFCLRYEYSYWLRNFEDGTILLWKVNPTGSPWIKKMAEAREWLKKKEEERLSLKTVDVPTTKWEILRFSVVSVKAIIDRQPLLGTGPLPPWLRNLAHSRNMVCLDTYNDNLCRWRCIAVHQGAGITRCTRAARRLCQTFLETNARVPPKISMDELDNVERLLNKNEKPTKWLHIRVFEPELLEDGTVLWHLIRNVPEKVKIF